MTLVIYVDLTSDGDIANTVVMRTLQIAGAFLVCEDTEMTDFVLDYIAA